MSERPKYCTDIPIVAEFTDKAVTDPAVIGTAQPRPRPAAGVNGTAVASPAMLASLPENELEALIASHEQAIRALNEALKAKRGQADRPQD